MISMGGIWDRTVEFIGDRLGRIIPIALLALFVPSAVSGSLSGLQSGAAPLVGLSLGVVMIGLALIQLWGQLAITALAVDPALDNGATRVATARLLPTIGIYIVVGLLFLLLFAPLIAILLGSGVTVEQLRSGTAATALTPGVVGALLLTGIVILIVALFAAARLMALLPVLAMERRGIGSIMRSVRLTRGLTWRLVGVVTLYIIVVSVATLAAQTVFGSVFRLIAGDASEGISIATVITAVVVAAVETAFSVMAGVFMGKLYAALVVREDDTRAVPAAQP